MTKLCLIIFLTSFSDDVTQLGHPKKEVIDFVKRPDKQEVLIAYQNSIDIFEIYSNTLVDRIESPENSEIRGLVLSESGEELFVWTTTNKVFSLKTGTKEYVLKTSLNERITSIEFAADGIFAIGTSKGEFKNYSSDGKLIYEILFQNGVSAIEFDHQNQQFFVSDLNGHVKGIDLQGKILWTFDFPNPVFDINYCKDLQEIRVASSKEIEILRWNNNIISNYQLSKNDSWVTTIDDLGTTFALGLSSGMALVETNFGQYNVKLPSSITKICYFLSDSGQIQLLVLSLDQKLRIVKKMKLN